MKKMISLAMILLSASTMAETIVTLEDGRQVQLNDDFTWSYINTETEKSSVNNAVAVIPVKSTTTGTIIEPGVTENTLQLSNSGADILLGKPDYKNGVLEIPTSITNQSTQSIVAITLNIDIFDLEGNSLLSEEVKVWSSIKRMADTYLRPQQSVQGISVKAQVPEKDKYQIQVVVTEVETR